MSKDSLAALLRALLSPCKEDIWAKVHYSDPENERNSFRNDDYGNWIHRGYNLKHIKKLELMVH